MASHLHDKRMSSHQEYCWCSSTGTSTVAFVIIIILTLVLSYTSPVSYAKTNHDSIFAISLTSILIGTCVPNNVLLYQFRSNGTRHILLPQWYRGAPQFLTDINGNVVCQQDTNIWRNKLQRGSDNNNIMLTNNIRYPGQFDEQLENLTGDILYYNINRYYIDSCRYLSPEYTPSSITWMYRIIMQEITSTLDWSLWWQTQLAWRSRRESIPNEDSTYRKRWSLFHSTSTIL